MRKRLLFSATLLLTCVSVSMAAAGGTETKGTASSLTAAQIVEKNVQARGRIDGVARSARAGNEGQDGRGRK